jgi:hypothetical protein
MALQESFRAGRMIIRTRLPQSVVPCAQFFESHAMPLLTFLHLMAHGIDLQSQGESGDRFSTCSRASVLNESKQSENAIMNHGFHPERMNAYQAELVCILADLA